MLIRTRLKMDFIPRRLFGQPPRVSSSNKRLLCIPRHWAEPTPPKRLHWALRYVRNTAIVLGTSMFIHGWHFKNISEEWIFNGQIEILPYTNFLFFLYKEVGILTTHMLMIILELVLKGLPPGHPLHKTNLTKHGFEYFLRPDVIEDMKSEKGFEILESITTEMDQYSSMIEEDKQVEGEEISGNQQKFGHSVSKVFTWTTALVPIEEHKELANLYKNHEITKEEYDKQFRELAKARLESDPELSELKLIVGSIKGKERSATKDEDKGRDKEL